jgi:hypothetical protein
VTIRVSRVCETLSPAGATPRGEEPPPPASVNKQLTLATPSGFNVLNRYASLRKEARYSLCASKRK